MNRILKTAILSIIFFQVSGAHAADLAQNMKAMKKLFKQMKTDVSNSTKNTSTAEAANKFIVILDDVLKQVPDSLNGLPADKKAAAVEGYKKLIGEEKAAAQGLIAALTKDKAHPDNAAAARFVAQMDEVEGRGHDQYKK